VKRKTISSLIQIKAPPRQSCCWYRPNARSLLSSAGACSSVFDFLTFYALLHLFGAGEALFQTGWFIESITTQVLVVIAIRTRRRFFRSKPHKFLVAMALGSVAAAVALPLLPVGRWFDFVAPPPLFFVFLVGAPVAYLSLVEIAKGFFYRFAGRRGPACDGPVAASARSYA
jgi:Mg2+-importing ATPase